MVHCYQERRKALLLTALGHVAASPPTSALLGDTWQVCRGQERRGYPHPPRVRLPSGDRSGGGHAPGPERVDRWLSTRRRVVLAGLPRPSPSLPAVRARSRTQLSTLTLVDPPTCASTCPACGSYKIAIFEVGASEPVVRSRIKERARTTGRDVPEHLIQVRVLESHSNRRPDPTPSHHAGALALVNDVLPPSTLNLHSRCPCSRRA